MSADDPLPDEVAQWSASQLGVRVEALEAVDVSWPRASSRVWRLAAGQARPVYVKLAADEQHYTREVFALRAATPSLGNGGAPQLRAHDPHLLAVMTSALTGTLVKALPTGRQDQVVRYHAGRQRRLLHQAVKDSAASRGRATELTEQLAEQALKDLPRVAGLLPDAQVSFVHHSCEQAVALGPGLPVAFTHGDYRPRNWLWDTRARRLRVLDFDRADFRPAVADFVWLATADWARNPAHKRVFLSGYGRDLSPEEVAALPAFTALAALNAGQCARQHGDGEDLARALQTLSLLADASRP